MLGHTQLQLFTINPKNSLKHVYNHYTYILLTLFYYGIGYPVWMIGDLPNGFI